MYSHAAQTEKIMARYTVAPLVAVGLEGFFGAISIVLAMPILARYASISPFFDTPRKIASSYSPLVDTPPLHIPRGTGTVYE